jgi:hypothetical protein
MGMRIRDENSLYVAVTFLQQNGLGRLSLR